MSSLVSYSIPNLAQGISQQPDAQRDPSQAEIQINGMSSIVEGLRKRDCSETIGLVSNSSFGDCFIHSILRDKVEEYLAVISSSTIKIYDLDGTEKTVNPVSNAYNYLSTITDAKTQLRAVTIADFTFITNTLKVPAMTSDVAPVVARPTTHEALIWVRAATYGQTYRVNINGTEVTVQTAVAPVVASGSTVTENRISSEEIATNIINGFSSLSGVSFNRSGAVIHVTSNNAITIAVSDARSNADITAIFDKVQAFTELPTIAPDNYQVTIEGDPTNAFDDYHVSFAPKSGTFGEGTWSETVRPGDKYKIDINTMPHLLVALPDGTFFFGPANGSTQSGTINGVAWEVKIPSWGERIAGDTETAPNPSFIGNPINDIFIYKNRLGFLADENVILSRVRSLFDFFPETVTAVLDSDPIDVVASNNRVSILKYAVPYQDELILFSSQYQFRFNAAETILTPATAQITVLTQFEIDTNVRPQLAGGGIIFCQANGDFSQFREFSVRGAGTALTADAQDLTGYVSAYVPSSVFKITVNDTSNALFALSHKTGFKNRIYVYKYFLRSGSGGVERAQSSWSHWTFSGADEILQVLCIRETLFCLMRYGTKVFLERIPVQDRSPEPPTGSPYPLLLDRRISTTTETPTAMRVASGTYNANANTTTWTLPFDAAATTQAWSGFHTTFNGGVLLSTITSGNTITASGNWAGAPIFFGESYEFRYRFTKFKLYKEIGGGKAAANVERTQVRHAKLRYHETAYFDIEVTAERRDTAVYKFDGTVLASRISKIGSALPNGYDPDDDRYKEGVFSVPIMSRGERCNVEIKNDTPHPCKFSTCEWVALITGKARALR
jgi:hypothetical protein